LVDDPHATGAKLALDPVARECRSERQRAVGGRLGAAPGEDHGVTSVPDVEVSPGCGWNVSADELLVDVSVGLFVAFGFVVVVVVPLTGTAVGPLPPSTATGCGCFRPWCRVRASGGTGPA